MRRVCLDTASNYFHNRLSGFLNTPAQARAHFNDKTFTFHAATTFDSSSRKYRGFTDYKELFGYLLKADEIITFNGRTCDLIVLENLIGEGPMRSLWQKPHHDLRGWRMNFSLKGAASDLLPDMKASWDTVKSERLAKIRKSSDNDFVANHLADTYRDVRFTLALFCLYEKSGDKEYTFHDN
jgi:hypothetical protein